MEYSERDRDLGDAISLPRYVGVEAEECSWPSMHEDGASKTRIRPLDIKKLQIKEEQHLE